MEEYEIREGKEPGMDLITQGTGLSMEDVLLCLEADRQVDSLYATLQGEDGKEIDLLERVQQDGGQYAMGTLHSYGRDEEKEVLLNKMLVGQLLRELPGKERQILVLRFFQNRTQSQVAELLGSSQVKVSRMEKRILKTLREKVLVGNGNIL